MAKHTVDLIATKGLFMGLAKQNMLFHQCIGELVDNSIASKKDAEKFKVEIIFHKLEGDKVGLYIADNCRGMTLEKLKNALQLGMVPDDESDRLHEHGFGLKNALATFTRGNGYWKIWTQDQKNMGNIFSVEGPFGPEMEIEDKDAFPNKVFLPSDISTLVYAEISIDYIRTVQGRGGPTKDLFKLREWLIEHLGVFYRGYLEQNNETLEIDGSIIVSINKDRKRVPPISIPFSNAQKKYFQIELGGIVYDLEYEYGTLDEVKRDKLLQGSKSQYYYQKNIPTQGIDIRLGKRVIATSLLDSVWKTQDGESKLNRHNDYNDFVGELKIPNVPRGILSTVNNKTDFNLDDPNWGKVFEELNKFPPPKRVREKTEKSLQEKWIKMLKATNPEDIVTDEKNIWPTGSRIDVYRKRHQNDEVIIYELKVGNAQPIHIYQLIMYWDGLEVTGEVPKEGILLVEDYNSTIEEMVSIINSKLKTPNGKSYNIKIEKHADKNL
jgi:hypothetical protein